MKVRVLGCSGGIGGRHLRTTSLLVDHDILIDAGTGVADLPLAELAMIDHVFLTHSHLDHIASLPLMIDSVADLRETPVTVHATEATLEALRKHIFNWAIWPDFSQISIRDRPAMRYAPLRLGQRIPFGERSVMALPAVHTVPAVGYLLDSGSASLAFTGDTTSNDAFWSALDGIANLRYLVIETAFSDREKSLAELSRHLCPSLLRSELEKLKQEAKIFISHLKPGQVERIMDEIIECAGELKPELLQVNHVFEF